MEMSESNATVTWSLREELLLAFAVKRHGLKKWETVAMELQSRSSDGFLFTAGICKERYVNLRRRFKHSHGGGGGSDGRSGGDDDGGDEDVLESEGGGGGEGEEEEEEFWWLEELRKLRVAELKTEVQRYDQSIESLKIKMKTIEEEGDKTLQREAKMADLDEEKEGERSENDKNNGEKAASAEVAGNSGSGEEVNRSFNESNSTENTRTGLANEPKPVENKPNSNSTLKPVEEDSCNDSSDSKEREREKERVNSAELVINSSTESREEGSHGTKGSSADMQSSASQMVTRKRIKRHSKAGYGGGGGVTAATPATVGLKKGLGGGGVAGRKPEPMFGVLDVIRAHKNGYVFQRRLEIQKSRKYNNMIRQHVDLEMVQARIEDGYYTSCPAKIYVDLLLLLNNAIVFFPKSSSQSRVAHQLRQVVMNHIKKHSPIPPPPPFEPLTRLERSGSLLEKQKSTAPIVVCKKRSNIAHKKPDSNPNYSGNKSTLSTSNEEDGGIKSKSNEKPPVTGVRSVRKGVNVRPRLSPPPPLLPRNLTGKPESSKKAVVDVDKKKGAANFLKRIKKNEPPAQASGGKKDDVVGRGGGSTRRVKEENSVKTPEITTRRIGRPPKRGKEVLKGKRDRDGEEDQGSGSLRRPIKRSRR